MSEQSTGSGQWTEPGVFEVAPGVHRVPLPLPNDGLRAVNVYVVVSDDGFVCIDSGWAIEQARPLLVSALAELGGGLGDIRRFLITHIHRDHYTHAIAIRREFGTTVALGIDEKPSLELAMQPDRRPMGEQIANLELLGAHELAQLMGRFMEAPDHHRAEWELPDEWLTPGEVSGGGDRRLEVVPTPGHTQGHVVFHDLAGRLLFAGDHVLPTITPSIGFEPTRAENALGDFMDSLALVRSRPDALLLPAHGDVAPSVHARVDELLAHHGKRLDEIEQAVRDGASTAYDVASRLRWTRRERRLRDLDPFNQLLATAETASHLQLLVVQGRLSRSDVDGVRHYS